MSDATTSYTSPDAWRRAAMRRSGTIDAEEIDRRRAVAEAHRRAHGLPGADALADQELYILGKMGLEEYRDYLIFKGMYGAESHG